MTRDRRWRGAAVALGLTLAGVSGCGSRTAVRPATGVGFRAVIGAAETARSTATAQRTRTVGFSDNGIAFRYPSTWRAKQYDVVSSFENVLVFLSPQAMHTPCHTRRGTHTTTVTCGDPVARLRRDSLLVTVSTHGFPGWTFTATGGVPLTVGGWPAKWSVQAGQPDIAATERVSVVIPVPHLTDNWYELDADLRGPRLAPLLQQFRALLATVQWH